MKISVLSSIFIVLAGLTVADTEQSLFTLVDKKGSDIGGEKLGLLLYRGGTVCDDKFDVTAANAICRHMGYTDATRYTSTESFDIQSDYEINLDDVDCSSEEWESCSFSEDHNCRHNEDVFLSCISILEGRNRIPGEIIPAKAEQSQTKNNNNNTYAAEHILDLDWETLGGTSIVDGVTWFKLSFDEVHCVHEVFWYDDPFTPWLTWICSETDCSTCEGDACTMANPITATVSTEGTTPADLPPLSDCRYGDTVMLQSGQTWLEAAEFVITEHQKGWIPVTHSAIVDFNLQTAPLEIKTNAVGGNVLVALYADPDYIGAIDISFGDPDEYQLRNCDKSVLAFDNSLPSAKEKLWRITLTEDTALKLVIHCNGKEVLTRTISCNDRPGATSTTWEMGTQKRIIFFRDGDTSLYYRPGTMWPWRSSTDLRCGANFPASIVTTAECNPDDPHGHACCSPNGWCGRKAVHCSCTTCIDYRVWTPITVANRGTWIDYDIESSALEIKTQFKHGRDADERMWVAYTDGNGNGGGLDIVLSNTPTYDIRYCLLKDEEFTMPVGNVQIWIIAKTDSLLTLHCNGVKIFSFQFSTSRRNECVDKWRPHMTKFMISNGDTASDAYYIAASKVDGGWSSFGSWSNCSSTCGGTKFRSRTCTNPVPKYGGGQCSGAAVDSRNCNTDSSCPECHRSHGWEDKFRCVDTYGCLDRSWVCDGGADCRDGSDEVNCRVDGGWSSFGSWSSCSATCGGGTQSRSRTCTNPVPKYGGSCSGAEEDSRDCNTQTCYSGECAWGTDNGYPCDSEKGCNYGCYGYRCWTQCNGSCMRSGRGTTTDVCEGCKEWCWLSGSNGDGKEYCTSHSQCYKVRRDSCNGSCAYF